MGLFSTVNTDLACERCGSTYRTGVQFKTGEDWALPVYEAGQVVPALPPGSDCEGIADAFCPDCAKRCSSQVRRRSVAVPSRKRTRREDFARRFVGQNAMKKRPASLATMVALSWALCSVAAGQPSHRFRATGAVVTDVGSIGSPQSAALDINDAGQVVGWATTMTGVQHAFLFSNGSMTDIGAGFGPFANVANGINSSGAVVGTLTDQFGPVGLLWQGGGAQFLQIPGTTLPPDPTYGVAINDSGDVCGYFFQPNALSPGPLGMVWRNGLAQPGAHEGTPVDINSSGFVVGDMARWTPTGHGLFHLVPVPPPASTGYSGGESLALNDHGYVVGSISLTSGPGSPAERAYVWDGSSPNSVEIGVLPMGNNSHSEDINELTFIAGYADEHVVRGPFNFTHEVAFLYHRDFGLFPLPFLSSTTPLGSCRAVAINEWQPSTSLIQLAGECDTLTGSRAVRWDVTVQSVSILPQVPIANVAVPVAAP